MIARIPVPVRAGLVALATLAACEGAARLALARAPLPDSYAEPCIPTHQRGFVAYTRPRPRPAGERLVIVLSNSQGQVTWNARFPGPTLFPAQVERRLGRGVRVLNWSVVGGGGAELTVLAARAAAHRPDAIVLVAGGLNFSGRSGTEPLSGTGSDVEELAYLPEVRRLLPERFLDRHSAYEVPGWLAAHVGLVRWRHRFVEQRAGNWFPTTAGLPDLRFLADLEGGRAGPGIPGVRTAEPWGPEGDALLEDLREVVRAGAPEARLLIVSQPVCWFMYDDASQPALAGLASAAARLFRDDGRVRVVDMLKDLPPGLFFTWSHLTREGHARLAERLVPHVRWALGE